MTNIFSGKNVLITGHTGFKGGWLSCILRSLGAQVYGVSKSPVKNGSVYNCLPDNLFSGQAFCDVSDEGRFCDYATEIKPDFIFHLAAQPLVLEAYASPYETFKSNTMGTINVLEWLRKTNDDVVCLLITSDKVYENVEWLYGYREIDQLGGKDPYSASKSMAELAIRSYYKSFLSGKPNVKLAVARAGNVIGGGDWSDNRLVPDCIRAWRQSMVVTLRNPAATRPWQHVLEPLSGYLHLAELLAINNDLDGEAFNFGPNPENNHAVVDLVDKCASFYNASEFTVEEGPGARYEAGLLKLNIDKAQRLGWKPRLSFDETIRYVMEWYVADDSGEDMYAFTSKQVRDYFGSQYAG